MYDNQQGLKVALVTSTLNLFDFNEVDKGIKPATFSLPSSYNLGSTF